LHRHTYRRQGDFQVLFISFRQHTLDKIAVSKYPLIALLKASRVNSGVKLRELGETWGISNNRSKPSACEEDGKG
jgi:hypothetical protein